ncbi:hypothetical protein HanXRQr2_Chr04g0161961 [Helianthus annuus]|nr:hypothetical protein HanXRQr2_Chr04g0161961 [Helianthus annuus]KAJ0930985.1 hypothetical protein HanPSC8_Chr04g0156051 [Helianthus annuus]
MSRIRRALLISFEPKWDDWPTIIFSTKERAAANIILLEAYIQSRLVLDFGGNHNQRTQQYQTQEGESPKDQRDEFYSLFAKG